MSQPKQQILPRIMLAAPASGSGKTMVTCALLKALQNRQLKTQAFKCGPDYIDPMFHTQVTGCPCRNLDTYFSDADTVKYLCAKAGAGADIAIMEGVMGYFDGVGGNTMQASAYDLADTTDTPVVLIVNAKGMSLSLIPYIKGFLDYEPHKHIQGVILNRTSPMMYKRFKEMIEQELDIQVLGYFPESNEGFAGSRYLGLKLPQEIETLQETIQNLAETIEKTVDMDKLIALANTASDITFQSRNLKHFNEPVTIGIAKDEAFCFYYQDNIELLQELGATIQYFSPLHDRQLPQGLDGILLGGGYPELFAKALSENQTMKQDIFTHLQNGLPYLAECGGFLYLQEQLEDDSQHFYDMVGFLKGKAYNTGKLGRFGYITLKPNIQQNKQEINDQTISKTSENAELNLQIIKGHEFHYYDTSNPGLDYTAEKPVTGKKWDCIVANEQGFAGFPHLYYYSNPEFAKKFYERCIKYHG